MTLFYVIGNKSFNQKSFDCELREKTQIIGGEKHEN